MTSAPIHSRILRDPGFRDPSLVNDLSDFKAPPETSRPLQLRLEAIKRSTIGLDSAWLQLNKIFATTKLSDEEKATLERFVLAKQLLDDAVAGRPSTNQPDQAPQDGFQKTA